MVFARVLFTIKRHAMSLKPTHIQKEEKMHRNRLAMLCIPCIVLVSLSAASNAGELSRSLQIAVVGRVPLKQFSLPTEWEKARLTYPMGSEIQSEYQKRLALIATGVVTEEEAFAPEFKAYTFSAGGVTLELENTARIKNARIVNGVFQLHGVEIDKSGCILLFGPDGRIAGRHISRFTVSSEEATLLTQEDGLDVVAFAPPNSFSGQELLLGQTHKAFGHKLRYSTQLGQFVAPVVLIPSAVSENFADKSVWDSVTVLVNAQTRNIVGTERFCRNEVISGNTQAPVHLDPTSVASELEETNLVGMTVKYSHNLLAEPAQTITNHEGFRFEQNLPIGGTLEFLPDRDRLRVLRRLSQERPIPVLIVRVKSPDPVRALISSDGNEDQLGQSRVTHFASLAEEYDGLINQRLLADPIAGIHEEWQQNVHATYLITAHQLHLPTNISSPGSIYINAGGRPLVFSFSGNNMFNGTDNMFLIGHEVVGHHGLFSRTGRFDLGGFVGTDASFLEGFAKAAAYFFVVERHPELLNDRRYGTGMALRQPDRPIWDLENGAYCPLDPLEECSEGNGQYRGVASTGNPHIRGLYVAGFFTDLALLMTERHGLDGFMNASDLMWMYVQAHAGLDIGPLTPEDVELIKRFDSVMHTPSSTDLIDKAALRRNLSLITRADFRRGDLNGNGQQDISDAVSILRYLFAGTSMQCRDAADANDDGVVTVTDAIALLNYLFLRGKAIPEPRDDCGLDPTDGDFLVCLQAAGCQP